VLSLSVSSFVFGLRKSSWGFTALNAYLRKSKLNFTQVLESKLHTGGSVFVLLVLSFSFLQQPPLTATTTAAFFQPLLQVLLTVVAAPKALSSQILLGLKQPLLLLAQLCLCTTVVSTEVTRSVLCQRDNAGLPQVPRTLGSSLFYQLCTTCSHPAYRRFLKATP